MDESGVDDPGGFSVDRGWFEARAEFRAALTDTIATMLGDGEPVAIEGFGSFSVRRFAAYEGTDPRTGDYVRAPAKGLAFFRPAPDLRKAMDQASDLAGHEITAPALCARVARAYAATQATIGQSLRSELSGLVAILRRASQPLPWGGLGLFRSERKRALEAALPTGE